MEGGQGFIPTHAVAEIKERMRDRDDCAGPAAISGYCGVDLDPAGGLRMGFDKLHNDAYACDAESSDMHNAHRGDARAAEHVRRTSRWSDGTCRATRGCSHANIPSCR
jgi:hypothetical protein